MKKKILIILQARCSSKRFRYKSIYPINQIPLAILCAKRLVHNTNFDLIIATSSNKKDKYLTELAKKNNIKYFSGSETNVLSRYLKITENLDKNYTIVRATADNPLPDGNFVKKCIKIYFKYNLNYFYPNHKYYKIPYGLNIEVINLNLLRAQIKTKENIEHVTFSIKKKFNSIIVKDQFIKKDYSNINFSIDYVKDYLKTKKIMEKHNIFDTWSKILKDE